LTENTAGFIAGGVFFVFPVEVYLTRLFENPEDLFTANAYKYTLSFAGD